MRKGGGGGGGGGGETELTGWGSLGYFPLFVCESVEAPK